MSDVEERSLPLVVIASLSLTRREILCAPSIIVPPQRALAALKNCAKRTPIVLRLLVAYACRKYVRIPPLCFPYQGASRGPYFEFTAVLNVDWEGSRSGLILSCLLLYFVFSRMLTIDFQAVLQNSAFILMAVQIREISGCDGAAFKVRCGGQTESE